jgi:hypothetical protein
VESAEEATPGKQIRVGLLALLAIVGFDLLLHAGVLSPLYSRPTPFLLESAVAFRRIPLGYASFALLVLLLEWLMVRQRITGVRRGAVFGLQFGSLVWVGLALGLASITTARPVLLLGWAVGQSLEFGLAGAVVGAGLASTSLRGLTWRVVVLFFACSILGIVIQNILS